MERESKSLRSIVVSLQKSCTASEMHEASSRTFGAFGPVKSGSKQVDEDDDGRNGRRLLKSRDTSPQNALMQLELDRSSSQHSWAALLSDKPSGGVLAPTNGNAQVPSARQRTTSGEAQGWIVRPKAAESTYSKIAEYNTEKITAQRLQESDFEHCEVLRSGLVRNCKSASSSDFVEAITRCMLQKFDSCVSRPASLGALCAALK